MDTALPQKFPFILDRNLAKANCTGNRVCTSCDIVVLVLYNKMHSSVHPKHAYQFHLEGFIENLSYLRLRKILHFITLVFLSNKVGTTSIVVALDADHVENHFPGDGVIVLIPFVDFLLPSSEMGAHESDGRVAHHQPDTNTSLVAWWIRRGYKKKINPLTPRRTLVSPFTEISILF